MEITFDVLFLGKFTAVVLQVQHDLGSSLNAFSLRDLVGAIS